MPVLKKIKSILGIEGVKIKIEAPSSINLLSRSVKFNLAFMTKSVQYVDQVQIKIIEKYKRGWGNSKLIDQYELYNEMVQIDLQMWPNEEFVVPIELHFDYSKSNIEKIADIPLMENISKTLLKLKNAKSDFRMEVSARVKNTRMQPLAVHNFSKILK